MSKITAKDIAAQLGLSAAAVSLAINGKKGVSPETRTKVLEAFARAGYSLDAPRSDAISSPKKPMQTLCFMIFVDELLHIWENSPFYTFNMQGVEAAATAHGYNTLIRYLQVDSILAPSNLQFLQSVDGLILLGTDITDRRVDDIRAMLNTIPDTPTVVLDSMMLSDQVDSLGNDNFGGAYQAISHLVQRGCKKITYLCSHTRISIFEEREAGLHAALADAGMSLFSKVPVGISNDDAFGDILAWLRSESPLPDAIFAENDVLAAAAARAMTACGIDVPRQISIIGFDNIPVSEQTNPPLSTIHSYKDDLGATAVHLLIQRHWMNQYPLGRGRGSIKVQMSTRLVDRSSVK